MSDNEQDENQSMMEEEEEEEEDENEMDVHDDFIDDQSYENDYDPSMHRKRKKRKRKHHQHENLDDDFEEDKDLIRENIGGEGKSKRKRIKKNREKLKEELEAPKYEDEESDQEEKFLQEKAREVHNEKMGLFKQIFEDSEDSDDKEDQEEDEDRDTIRLKKTFEMGVYGDDKFRNEILKTDIPERIYIRLKDRLNPSEGELFEEATWIYHSKKHWKGYHVGEERMIESIQNVLKHFRKSHFDIPFIATFR